MKKDTEIDATENGEKNSTSVKEVNPESEKISLKIRFLCCFLCFCCCWGPIIRDKLVSFHRTLRNGADSGVQLPNTFFLDLLAEQIRSFQPKRVCGPALNVCWDACVIEIRWMKNVQWSLEEKYRTCRMWCKWGMQRNMLDTQSLPDTIETI